MKRMNDDQCDEAYFHHSVCDSMLWSYLHGELEPTEALLVATHVALHDKARTRLKELNTCNAVALETVKPVKMSCSAEAFFNQKCCAKKQVTQEPEKTIDGDVPKPLQKFIGQSLDKVAWKEILPGVAHKSVGIKGGRGRLHLIKAAQGTQVAKHDRAGHELLLVLRGSFTDGDQRYTPGEVSVHFPESEHAHVPIADQECICLMVVAHGGLRLPGLWGRFFNPILAVLPA